MWRAEALRGRRKREVPARLSSAQGPDGAVEEVAAHVSEGARPEVPPAAPLERMQMLMIVAEGGRADPLVPMHALRHR